MVLHIDPRLPLVWRSPSSVQVGVDDPRVVLENVSPAQERLLAALAVGTTRAGLDLIGQSAGAAASDIDALITRIRPVLRDSAPSRTTAAITLAGVGPTAILLADALTSSGLTVKSTGADPQGATGPADLAVVVAHFVVDPEFHGLWLRRDIPHLPVVFGDTVVSIGPIVEPGSGPCLYCLYRDRADSDPTWPAIASQLWGRRSPLDSGLAAAEAASIAARMVAQRLAAGRPGQPTIVRLTAATGVRTERLAKLHPECGCEALPGSATAGAA